MTGATSSLQGRVSPLEPSTFNAWMDKLDAFMLDCDGVLWCEDSPVPGAKDFVALLRAKGKRVVFVTNNATKSRAAYVAKLARHGIPAVESDIVTSAWATVQYMKQEGITGKVYAMGEAGLVEELEAEGYKALGLEDGGAHELPRVLTVDKDIRTVVVALDRNMNYYKLSYAAVCIRENPGCRFIATNGDQTFPTDGAILPGGGCLVKFIETAVGHPPEAVVGKPSQDLLKTILKTYGVEAKRTCMVGDRLSTDMEFGVKGGCATLLVMTGVTTPEQLASNTNPDRQPDYAVDSVDVINQLHRAAEKL